MAKIKNREHQTLARRWRNQIIRRFLVRMENFTATLGNRLVVSYETDDATTILSSNFTDGHLLQRNKNLKNLHTMLTTALFAITNVWTVKQTLLYPEHGKLLSNKKECIYMQWLDIDIYQCNVIYNIDIYNMQWLDIYNMQWLEWISKELCWVKKSNPQRSYTVLFHLYNILEMTKLYVWKAD